MASDSRNVFFRLASLLGVHASFVHAGGWPVEIDLSVMRHLVRALGFDPDHPVEGLERLHDEKWRRALPPVVVAPAGREIEVEIVVPRARRRLSLALWREDGESEQWAEDVDRLDVLEKEGDRQRLRLKIRPAMPLSPGYHSLGLDDLTMPLILVPDRCFDLAARRTWGFSVQLYGLRSNANRGHGDFADLFRLAEISSGLGAGFLGISPPHALFPDQPERRSPYSPNSRIFLSPLHIHARGRQEKSAPESLVDYGRAAAELLPIYRRMFDDFSPGGEYRDFLAQGGDELQSFAVFEALRHRFGLPWKDWPEEFRCPKGGGPAAFADENRREVDFHLWLQFEADRQLGLAAEAASSMPLGLYRDVAVGFDRDGFDSWMHQDLTPAGISVGCPPDLRNPVGQDWGVLTFSPHALRSVAYDPFIRMIRANMRHAGVLRIDHAFQLTRLYWIPLGAGPKEGGYVGYPARDLLGLIALESRRNNCAVVAEDLGTIPEGFREQLMQNGALSFRVLHRERESDRAYKPPASYPEYSTVALGTHDQATVAGFWAGRDLALRRQLGLFPSAEDADQAVETRSQDKRLLLLALKGEGLLGEWEEPEDDQGRPSDALILALHRYIARTPSRMLVVQPEDLTGESEQANMPGTLDTHPNWRRRYDVAIDDLARHPRISALSRMLVAEGRGGKS